MSSRTIHINRRAKDISHHAKAGKTLRFVATRRFPFRDQQKVSFALTLMCIVRDDIGTSVGGRVRQRCALLDALADVRSRARISQSTIARRIKTSQPAIARLEAGSIDLRLSTIQRYAASLGKRIGWTLADAE